MKFQSLLFLQSPRWQSQLLKRHFQLSEELYSWLTETGSLTKRLRGKYPDSFNVEVLLQNKGLLFYNESNVLSLERGRYQLIREVKLNHYDQCQILARTVLPERTIKIARNKLAHLGNKPLGEVIFAYPDLELQLRQYCQIEPQTWAPEIRIGLGITENIWGRRTMYVIHGQPLLVAEFFLPGLLL